MFLLLSVSPASAQRNNRRRTTTSSQSNGYANLTNFLKRYVFKVNLNPSDGYGTAWFVFFPSSNTSGTMSIRNGKGEEEDSFKYTIVSPTEIHFGTAIFNVYDNYIGVTFSNGRVASCTKVLRQ